MKRFLSLGICCAMGLIIATALSSPSSATDQRWHYFGPYCMNLDSVHSKDGFVMFNAIMGACNYDDIEFNGRWLAISASDCQRRETASELTVYENSGMNGDNRWTPSQYRKGKDEFDMASVACNWAFPSLF